MTNYELIIERKQPPCGGKDTKAAEIRNIRTDDPMAYVRSIDNEGEPKMLTAPNGDIVITVDAGEHHVRYTFTED